MVQFDGRGNCTECGRPKGRGHNRYCKHHSSGGDPKQKKGTVEKNKQHFIDPKRR